MSEKLNKIKYISACILLLFFLGWGIQHYYWHVSVLFLVGTLLVFLNKRILNFIPFVIFAFGNALLCSQVLDHFIRTDYLSRLICLKDVYRTLRYNSPVTLDELFLMPFFMIVMLCLAFDLLATKK